MEEMTLAAAAAYTVVKLAKPVVVSGVGMMEKLLGEPVAIASNLLADQVYCWQTANRIRCAAKIADMLKERNIPPSVLPKGFLMPMLDAVGNVEDDELQTLWARLTTNAVVDEDVRQPMFVSLLRQLSREDAAAFDAAARALTAYRFKRPALNGPKLKDEHARKNDSVVRLIGIGLMLPIYETQPDTQARALVKLQSGRVSYQPGKLRAAAVSFDRARISGLGILLHNALYPLEGKGRGPQDAEEAAAD